MSTCGVATQNVICWNQVGQHASCFSTSVRLWPRRTWRTLLGRRIVNFDLEQNPTPVASCLSKNHQKANWPRNNLSQVKNQAPCRRIIHCSQSRKQDCPQSNPAWFGADSNLDKLLHFIQISVSKSYRAAGPSCIRRRRSLCQNTMVVSSRLLFPISTHRTMFQMLWVTLFLPDRFCEKLRIKPTGVFTIILQVILHIHDPITTWNLPFDLVQLHPT